MAKNRFKNPFFYLTILFLVLAGYFLYQNLSRMDWMEIKRALEEVPLSSWIPALLLVFLNYLILSNYDYLAIRYLNIPRLRYLQVLPSALICYAFNLNLGATVGGIGFRFKIYTGWGVPAKKIPSLVLFSVLTNWSGFVLLLSLVLLFRYETVVTLIGIPAWGSILLGMACLSIVIAYLVKSHGKHELTVKGKTFKFPNFRMALLQLGLSSLQWILLAAIIFYFLKYFGATASLEDVLFIYLLASMTGLIIRIPAGLGVVETVFLKFEFGLIEESVLAALICFRIVYYLFPLALALPGYLYLEFYQRRRPVGIFRGD